MSLPFLIGAIIGSGVMLTLVRQPAHRAMAAIKARIANRSR